MFDFQQKGENMENSLPIMQSNAFFSGLTDTEILSILNCVDGRLVSKPKNAWFLEAGDVTEAMGLVLSRFAIQCMNTTHINYLFSLFFTYLYRLSNSINIKKSVT